MAGEERRGAAGSAAGLIITGAPRAPSGAERAGRPDARGSLGRDRFAVLEASFPLPEEVVAPRPPGAAVGSADRLASSRVGL